MVHFAKWKTWLTLAILAAGIIFALPNLLTQQQAESAAELGAAQAHQPRSRSARRIAPAVRGRYRRRRPRSPGVGEGRRARRAAKEQHHLYRTWRSTNDTVVAQLGDPADARQGACACCSDAIGVDCPRSTTPATSRVHFRMPELRDRPAGAPSSNRSKSSAAASTAEGVKEPTIHSPGRRSHHRAAARRRRSVAPGSAHRQDREDDVSFRQQRDPPTLVAPDPRAGAARRHRCIAWHATPANRRRFEVVETRVILSGENLGRRPGRDSIQQNGSRSSISQFDSAGARKFARRDDRENVGRAIRHRARQRGHQRARHQRTDPGGRGVISGNFTAQAAHDLAVLLARRRSAGAAGRAREAHGRRRTGRRFDRRRQDGEPHGPGADRRRPVGGLRPVRRLRQHRAGVQLHPADRRHVDAAGDADLARHRRHGADARHGGRRQRADP